MDHIDDGGTGGIRIRHRHILLVHFPEYKLLIRRPVRDHDQLVFQFLHGVFRIRIGFQQAAVHIERGIWQEQGRKLVQHFVDFRHVQHLLHGVVHGVFMGEHGFRLAEGMQGVEARMGKPGTAAGFCDHRGILMPVHQGLCFTGHEIVHQGNHLVSQGTRIAVAGGQLGLDQVSGRRSVKAGNDDVFRHAEVMCFQFFTDRGGHAVAGDRSSGSQSYLA